MRYTLRAGLAVALLGGFYLLCAGVVGFLVLLAYIAAELGGSRVPGMLLILILFVVYSLGTAIVASLKSVDDPDDGLTLTPEAQPELWNRVRELSREVRTRAPDEILLTPDVNASVVEHAKLLGLIPGRRRMRIGVPLLLAMTESQLYAVLGHELGHYSGRHTRMAVVTYRGSEALSRAVHELGTTSVIGRVFRMYFVLFLRVSNAVSRRQEIEADAVAARAVGRDAIVEALRHLAPLGAAWEEFLQQYVWPAHRVGLRPQLTAEGFLDFLDDPVRREQLAEIRDGDEPVLETIFDSHPPTAQRIARLQRLPDDRRRDDGTPGYAVLNDPDATMSAFFASLYDDRGAPLEPASWELIGEKIGHRHAESGAGVLVRSVQGQPHWNGRPVTLSGIASELRSGRGAELADRAFETRNSDEMKAVAGLMVGSVLGAGLVNRGLARYPLDWSGRRGRLVDVDGNHLDLGAIGDRAVRSRAGVAEWLGIAEDYGLPLDDPLEFPEPEPDTSVPPEPLACVAPVKFGWASAILMPSTRGIAIFRPRGVQERIAVFFSQMSGGASAKLARLVLRSPFEKALQRRGAELLTWEDIASVRSDRKTLKRLAVTITLLTGEVRRIKLYRHTDEAGYPWQVVAHFLGPRFEG